MTARWSISQRPGRAGSVRVNWGCMRSVRVMVLTLLSVSLLDAGYAAACTCNASNDTRDELERMLTASDVVFEGRAGRPEATTVDIIGPSTHVPFEVSRFFKGQLGPSVFVLGGGRSGIVCERDYDEGEVYLVYARFDSDGRLSDNICSRTRLLANADFDLGILGAGEPPAAIEAEPDPVEEAAEPMEAAPEPAAVRQTVGGCAVTPASANSAALAALALLGCTMLRRRTSR